MENIPQTHYLYGAAVQGIQSFIFQTNELKDIIGASELVEQVCTTEFSKLLGDSFNDDAAIVMAAGNIKYDFTDEESCRKVVREFPKQIMLKAPGITISQAVVKYPQENILNFESAVNELESRLRTQRNKPARSLTLGAMGILRARKAGLPAVGISDGDYVDLATQKKQKVVSEESPDLKLGWKMLENLLIGDSENKKRILKDLSSLKNENSWLAIIHIDGNGLGQVVQKIGSDPTTLKEFSRTLDDATKYAARCACERMKEQFTSNGIIPIRPIVLSGDDLTIICRADLALMFAKNFIEEFEYATGSDTVPEGEPISREGSKKTNETLKKIIIEAEIFEGGEHYLSACGGIAFIKNSYPFYYGYELAETLCSEAKKDSKSKNPDQNMKRLPASCLMFHKVQSSFVEDYKLIEAKELTAQNGVSFKYGPYYLKENNPDENKWSLTDLFESIKLLNKDENGQAVKNHLREWLTLLINNPGMADQYLQRTKSMARSRELIDFLKNQITRSVKGKKTLTPVYDLLSLISVQTNYK